MPLGLPSPRLVFLHKTCCGTGSTKEQAMVELHVCSIPNRLFVASDQDRVFFTRCRGVKIFWRGVIPNFEIVFAELSPANRAILLLS